MRQPTPIACPDNVRGLVSQHCVIAISVSGGKDSVACALAVCRYLDQVGHQGPRLLVHADLGMVEWKESLPSCERLAIHLGTELLVVRRQAGDMMERWEGRWSNNVKRYEDLSCAKLILPWSTPSMRFCTSELKTAVIMSALRRRFPDRDILNVTGIRRQESANRSQMSACMGNAKLQRKFATGLTWNPIIEWKIGEVFEEIAHAGLELHEAYTKYGASRVSCAFCIMSTLSDLEAGARASDNHDLYCRMVELEVRSTFAFQGNRWLADVAPHLLTTDLTEKVAQAKHRAAQREQIEAQIPKQLLFSKGFPVGVPSREEAEVLARARAQIAALLGLEVRYQCADSILTRYRELIEELSAKDGVCGRTTRKVIAIQRDFAF